MADKTKNISYQGSTAVIEVFYNTGSDASNQFTHTVTAQINSGPVHTEVGVPNRNFLGYLSALETQLKSEIDGVRLQLLSSRLEDMGYV